MSSPMVLKGDALLTTKISGEVTRLQIGS